MGNKSMAEVPQKQPLLINPEFPKYLLELCKQPKNQSINKIDYQAIMKKLEVFQVIRLVGTPLGDGLFDVIVSKGTPTISSIDFYNIIMDLACNQERRIYYTYKIYKKQADYILLEQFQKFVVESFDAAIFIFNQQHNTGVSKEVIYEWAKGQKQKFANAARDQFKKWVDKNGYFDESSFRKYLKDSPVNNINVECNELKVEVPLTLMKFLTE